MRRVTALVVFALCSAGSVAAEIDPDRLNWAMSCIETEGGPNACRAVLGWCDLNWGFDRRQVCEASILEGWDAVLNRLWGDLRSAVEENGVTVDAMDGVTPVWDRILSEQRAWLAFRDARCGWSFGAVEGDVRGMEEERLRCLSDTTRERAEQLFQMRQRLWFNRFVP